MDTPHQANNEQATLWNGHAGRAWVETQELLDHMFKPFEELLVDAVIAESATRVLDIGCGTGSTTLAAARRIGTTGRCTGIDISEPMIAAARARAAQENASANFIQADAQYHRFERGDFDMIMSRFGVMFFGDFVQAFANLRHAVNENAKLHFIAWRSPAENPFMTAAERAAAPLLPNLPVREPGAPGQFAFADQTRIAHILKHSGWRGVDIQPIDVTCTFPAIELDSYLTRLGSVGVILQEADEQTRKRVIETVRPAFDPYVHGTEVSFNAACWKVSAG